MTIAVITTFPNDCWEVYAKQMLQSFVQYWPKDIPLMVELDDDLLAGDVQNILNREGDAVAVGWNKDHKEFVERNKGRDDPKNYRKQAVRFCHKVFAIHRAAQSIIDAKNNNEGGPRYLIWLDADVITTKPVSMDDIKACLPKEGDAVSYMGRTDWDHSECGWLAFDLENSGDLVIQNAFNTYVSDAVLKLNQWHDSWVFDQLREQFRGNQVGNWTNLTESAKGMDVWPQSPMGKWSTHYKGPQAKANLANQKKPNMQSNIVIQTKNAIPHEEIRSNIATNQVLISNWIRPCKKTDEEIVVVSAGPMLIAEDVRKEKGRIVAVKHALEPLKKAGITPWACILLDPRPHVADFVTDPDPNVLWFVASQVDPKVTRKLLSAGCTVWGYHASVGADEQLLTKKQEHAIISGGSATATRGLFLLSHLGFRNMRLYGYDLCYPEKPNLNEQDDRGQPKYLEMSVGFTHPLYSQRRCFWSEPQLIAQFEEINDIIKTDKFKITAWGNGIVPFIIKAKETGELRERELRAKVNGKIGSYEQLLKCRKTTLFSMMPPLPWLPSHRKQTANSN
jgi:hypothetical protein